MNRFDLQMLVQYADQLHCLTGVECNIFEIQAKSFSQNGSPSFCTASCPRFGKTCDCANTHLYGCYEADRWSGRYIYYCSFGLIFVATSVKNDTPYSEYALVSGPILMGNRSDAEELDALCPEQGIVNLTTAQVSALSAVAAAVCGYTSESPYQKLHEYSEQSKVHNLIYEMFDRQSHQRVYPIDEEKQLQKYIALGDKAKSQEALNNLLGNIYFRSNGDFATIKVRALELVVLLSRASIDGGANIEQIFWLNNEFISQIGQIQHLEDLNVWLTIAMHRFISYVFDFDTVKHNDIIFKTIKYIDEHLMDKITLNDIACHVYLSRSYLSRIFKEEMNCNLTSFINKRRIEKSKDYLLDNSVNIIDIARLVGFEDQSYYTKVFKKICGISPGRFRELRGKI